MRAETNWNTGRTQQLRRDQETLQNALDTAVESYTRLSAHRADLRASRLVFEKACLLVLAQLHN